MILAGDVGGTKTLLGLFTPAAERPAMIEVGEFVTLDYDGLEAMIEAFLGAWHVEPRHLDTACIGIAGAITSQVGQMTNVPWVIDAAALSKRTGIRRVRLLNDLEALAYAVPVLEPAELEVLQPGTRVEHGNAAVIAAGTGLGESFLYFVDGRLAPGASEGGHADFAARTPRELEMVASHDPHLRARQRRNRHLRARSGECLPIHTRLVRLGAAHHGQQRGTVASVCGGRFDRRCGRSAGTNQSGGSRAAVSDVRRGDGHLRRRLRRGSRATWRCAERLRRAYMSAAASRRRFFLLSARVPFSRRSGPKSRSRNS